MQEHDCHTFDNMYVFATLYNFDSSLLYFFSFAVKIIEYL